MALFHGAKVEEPSRKDIKKMAQGQGSRAISNQSFNQEKKSVLYVQGICKPDICDKCRAADYTCPTTNQGLVTEVGIQALALFLAIFRSKIRKILWFQTLWVCNVLEEKRIGKQSIGQKNRISPGDFLSGRRQKLT